MPSDLWVVGGILLGLVQIFVLGYIIYAHWR